MKLVVAGDNAIEINREDKKDRKKVIKRINEKRLVERVRRKYS